MSYRVLPCVYRGLPCMYRGLPCTCPAMYYHGCILSLPCCTQKSYDINTTYITRSSRGTIRILQDHRTLSSPSRHCLYLGKRWADIFNEQGSRLTILFCVTASTLVVNYWQQVQMAIAENKGHKTRALHNTTISSYIITIHRYLV